MRTSPHQGVESGESRSERSRSLFVCGRCVRCDLNVDSGSSEQFAIEIARPAGTDAQTRRPPALHQTDQHRRASSFRSEVGRTTEGDVQLENVTDQPDQGDVQLYQVSPGVVVYGMEPFGNEVPVRRPMVTVTQSSPVLTCPRLIGDAYSIDGLTETSVHRNTETHGSTAWSANDVTTLGTTRHELDMVEQDEFVDVQQAGEVATPWQVGRLVGDENTGGWCHSERHPVEGELFGRMRSDLGTCGGLRCLDPCEATRVRWFVQLGGVATQRSVFGRTSGCNVDTDPCGTTWDGPMVIGSPVSHDDTRLPSGTGAGCGQSGLVGTAVVLVMALPVRKEQQVR